MAPFSATTDEIDNYFKKMQELKEKFSKYGEYTELNLTNDDDVGSYLKDCEVVILNRIRLGKKEFEKASNLRLVLLTGTGYNHN